jgi:hypothetical protein
LDIRDNPNNAIYEHLVTPRVEALSGRALAQTSIRRELVAAGASRSTRDLRGLLPLARTLGVTVAEAQRLSTFSRQTIYSVLNDEAASEFLSYDSERLARLLNIALVAAGKEQPLKQIGQALNVAPSALLTPARLLAGLDLAVLTMNGVEPDNAVLTPTDLSSQWLKLHASSQELDNQAPGYTAYLRIDPTEVRQIDAVVGEIVGLDEAAVLPAETAPSVMEGPELAITVRATDQRSALRITEAIWREIGQRLGRNTPMRVADLHLPPTAPNAPSVVLDAFLAGLLADMEEELGNRLRGEREGYDGGEPERVLAGRCLTLAARELRRMLGQKYDERMPAITNGDSAFEEWVTASSHDLESDSPESEKIRRPLLDALKLAAERLGPFRGGELASFKAPGQQPRVVREVAPSEEDLASMAHLSGAAIAAGEGGDSHLIAVIRVAVGAAGMGE